MNFVKMSKGHWRSLLHLVLGIRRSLELCTISSLSWALTKSLINTNEYSSLFSQKNFMKLNLFHLQHVRKQMRPNKNKFFVVVFKMFYWIFFTLFGTFELLLRMCFCFNWNCLTMFFKRMFLISHMITQSKISLILLALKFLSSSSWCFRFNNSSIGDRISKLMSYWKEDNIFQIKKIDFFVKRLLAKEYEWKISFSLRVEVEKFIFFLRQGSH